MAQADAAPTVSSLCGADAFMDKPFELEALGLTVAKMLGGQAASPT